MSRWRPKNQTEVEAIEFQYPLTVEREDGTTQKVQRGDFLLTMSNGAQQFMDRAEFLAMYDPVRKPGRKPKSETE